MDAGEIVGALVAVAVVVAIAARVIQIWRWQPSPENQKLSRYYHHGYRIIGRPARNGIAVAIPMLVLIVAFPALLFLSDVVPG